MRIGSRQIWIALALAAAPIGSGCGQLGTNWKGTRPVAPRLIQPADVARQPAGAPQRTLLAWFGALQRNDAAAAAMFYDPALRVSPDSLRPQRLAAAALLGELGAEIQDVSTDGNRAIVFTRLTARRVAPNGRIDTYVEPQAFDLVRVNGSWRIANDNFLQAAPALYRDLATRFARRDET